MHYHEKEKLEFINRLEMSKMEVNKLTLANE